MKAFFKIAAFAAAASAAVFPRDQCCFEITAAGGVSGVMGQLWDGQNRINGSYSPVTYCYSNGGIVDSTGRGCVVTYTNDATHQFQCDLNRPPTYGFAISPNGNILYQGSDQFYACPATDTEYNVYTTWLQGQDKCKPVTLSTGGTCSGASPSAGTAAPSGSAAAHSAPAYSSVGATAPAYSAPAESSPAYTSAVESSALGYSAPAYTSPQSVTAPAYSGPFSSSEVVVSTTAYTQTSAISVSTPAYSSGSSSVPAYSQPVVSPFLSSASFSSPVQTTPIQSTQAASTTLQGTTQTVPSYPAESSITSWSSPATVPAYGGPSSSSTVKTAYSSIESSASSVSIPASSASVPGYETSSAQPTPVEATTSTTCTEETSTAVWTTSTSPIAVTSVPGYGNTATATSSSSPAASTSTVPSYARSSSTPATQAASTSASACQTSLTGAYQTPHLIVPISSSQPDTAYGTQYNATINSEESTIFNFDIPSSYQGKTCSVIFLFPEQADLETSAYTFSGSGSLLFKELSGAVSASTTYDSAPSVKQTLDTIAIQPGNSYVVATTACAAGTTESIELSSSGGLSLEFFEDWNPSSLGLYITAC